MCHGLRSIGQSRKWRKNELWVRGREREQTDFPSSLVKAASNKQVAAKRSPRHTTRSVQAVGRCGMDRTYQPQCCDIFRPDAARRNQLRAGGYQSNVFSQADNGAPRVILGSDGEAASWDLQSNVSWRVSINTINRQTLSPTALRLELTELEKWLFATVQSSAIGTF